jgi:hypothetical protein
MGEVREVSGTCELLGGDEVLAKGLDEIPNHSVSEDCVRDVMSLVLAMRAR